MTTRVLTSPRLRAGVLAAAALAALVTPRAASAANLLANPHFSVPSGDGPTSLTGANVSGPSAAANWLVWNNTDATTMTELLPSTKIAGGTMIHVTTSGNYNGLYQTFSGNAGPDYACAWVYVRSGQVAIGAGFGADTGASVVLLKQGSWEVLNVSNAASPVTETIIYSENGPAEFYVASASVGTSQAQCKP